MEASGAGGEVDIVPGKEIGEVSGFGEEDDE